MAKKELGLKLLLEKEENYVEEILRRKKEEEHLKRLEFEEARIKKENEKMKIAAEEKKKREKVDDGKMKLEPQEKQYNVNTMEKRDEQESNTIDTEDQHLSKEKWKIKVGREETFREIQEKKKRENAQQDEELCN